jgi:pentatricopeptide repeat protein
MCERGRWKCSLAAFDEMKAAGLTPDVGTYDMLLSVLWLCGQRRTAIELYVEASKAGVYPPRGSVGVLVLDSMPLGPALAATTLWLDAIAAAAPDDLPDTLLVETPVFNQLSTQSIHYVNELCEFYLEEAGAKDDGVVLLRRKEKSNGVGTCAVISFMQQLESPFMILQTGGSDDACMWAARDAVCAWLARLGPVIQHVCTRGDRDAEVVLTRNSERRPGIRRRSNAAATT